MPRGNSPFLLIGNNLIQFRFNILYNLQRVILTIKLKYLKKPYSTWTSYIIYFDSQHVTAWSSFLHENW